MTLLLALLLALPVPAVAQVRDRIDSTLPAPGARSTGDRVIDTRGQRLRSEAQLREELARHQDLDRRFNPPHDAGVAVFPSIRPSGGSCRDPGCRPIPPVPFPDLDGSPRR